MRGKPYSEELGIDFKSCQREEISKWFLASILFAARISENIAKKTYKEFEKRGITNAEKISGADWHDLVAILDSGGYARYDFKTADKLLEAFGNLQKRYNGDLNKLHQEARDSRDMRYCWEKADPKSSLLVQQAMEKLGIEDLKDFANKKSVDIVRLEIALLRFGKKMRRRSSR